MLGLDIPCPALVVFKRFFSFGLLVSVIVPPSLSECSPTHEHFIKD